MREIPGLLDGADRRRVAFWQASDLAAEFERKCSFCGATSEQVKTLILCPTAGICNECVAWCNQVLAKGLAVPGA